MNPPRDKSSASKTASAQRGTEDPSTWVDRHGDLLYRYAIARLRDSHAAEEVVQQSFVAAIKHLDQFSGKASIRAWLLGILKRKIIDYVRQRSRDSSLASDMSADEPNTLFVNGSWTGETSTRGWHAFDSIERQEFWQILQCCLDGLPQRQAHVFALREMDNRSTEEICKVMNISSSNLWVLLHRARLRLAECLNSRWDDEVGK